jgi:exosortase C (VPDSG-CTERM-specific)
MESVSQSGSAKNVKKATAEMAKSDLSTGNGATAYDTSRGESLTRQHLVPLGFLSFAVLLTALFIKPLFSLAVHATHSDLHSHILLVPFVSAYLIYIRRHALPKELGSSPAWAIVPLLGGLGALAFAWTRSTWNFSQNDYLALMALSFVCLLAVGGFVFLGRKWMAAVAFPFAFLIFIVPIPDVMADTLETASKLASADAANLFLNLSGVPFLRFGTAFELPGIAIQVAQECSGIRSSWVLLITSLLASNLFLRSPWRRTILVVSVIPLAILRNGFRIAVIGLLCVHFGPRIIHSVIHKQGGPLFFALSLIPLFLMLCFLRRGDSRKASSEKDG